MRVLLAMSSERTHFLGLVPVAWGLRAAGHDVLVASQPELERDVAAAGLAFAPTGRNHLLKSGSSWITGLGDEFDGAFDWCEDSGEVLTWDYVLQGYREAVPWWLRMLNEPLVDDLVELCRSWRPDLVIWETTTHSAAVAARVCGAAHVRYVWSLDLFARMRGWFLRRMREQPEGEREDPLADWLSVYAERFGIDFSEDLVSGQATIDQTPPSLRVDARPDLHYLPMRYVPYNGRAVVPAWLRERSGRPRVCLTLGTSTLSWFREYSVSVADVLGALGELDVEIVATLPGGSQDLGVLPDNVRPVSYVPLHALVPWCSAVVNQAGPGTVLTSLASGAAQVLVARAGLFDAPLLARRVEEAGAGLSFTPGTASGEGVLEALRRVLEEPGFGGAARGLRAEMEGMATPAGLVKSLELLAEERTGSLV